jgi:two-component system cell cycle response regulator
MTLSANVVADEPSRRSGVTPAPSVLVVDDDDDTRLLVMTALARGQVRCTEASSGEDALREAEANADHIDCIVLDVVLPGINGIEVLRRLKASPVTAHIPVIIVSGTATEDLDIVSASDIGASDHLAKPCSPTVLLAKVRVLRTRSRADRALREELHFASLHAMSDALTGLFNRRNFEARMREASAYAVRHQEPFAVVMLDLDEFKKINDEHGHEGGDGALIHFAEALRSVMRADDVAFRYGGDELVLLLRACDAPRAAEVANRLRERLRASPFRYADGAEQAISFSAGAASAEESESFASENLVSRADTALYRAKAAGRDRVECWSPPV